MIKQNKFISSLVFGLVFGLVMLFTKFDVSASQVDSCYIVLYSDSFGNVLFVDGTIWYSDGSGYINYYLDETINTSAPQNEIDKFLNVASNMSIVCETAADNSIYRDTLIFNENGVSSCSFSSSVVGRVNGVQVMEFTAPTPTNTPTPAPTNTPTPTPTNTPTPTPTNTPTPAPTNTPTPTPTNTPTPTPTNTPTPTDRPIVSGTPTPSPLPSWNDSGLDIPSGSDFDKAIDNIKGVGTPIVNLSIPIDLGGVSLNISPFKFIVGLFIVCTLLSAIFRRYD